MPAKAGIQCRFTAKTLVPAFAGMTNPLRGNDGSEIRVEVDLPDAGGVGQFIVISIFDPEAIHIRVDPVRVHEVELGVDERGSVGGPDSGSGTGPRLERLDLAAREDKAGGWDPVS